MPHSLALGGDVSLLASGRRREDAWGRQESSNVFNCRAATNTPVRVASQVDSWKSRRLTGAWHRRRPGGSLFEMSPLVGLIKVCFFLVVLVEARAARRARWVRGSGLGRAIVAPPPPA